MKILNLVLFSGLLAGGSYAATLAHYDFTGSGTAAVGATITDSAGVHHGTVEGGPMLYGTDPIIGGYLRFDADGPGVGGLGNRVVIPGHSDFLFSLDQSYTIEAIFRTTQSGTNGVLVSKGCDVSNPDSQWWIRHQGNGTLRGVIEGTDTTAEPNATTSSSTPIHDGEWHHVALVLDAAANPRQLIIYLDGVQSGINANIGSVAGIIGGADTDPVIVGEYATLAANRSFSGDISALRFSNAALTPAEFLADGFTRIVNVNPVNGTGFLPAGTIPSFQIKSPSTGVPAANIQVTLNGENISSQLTLSGTDNDRTVTLPPVAADMLYMMEITVIDNVQRTVTARSGFNTFVTGLMFLEAEDYNYNGGQFIDNPALTPSPYLTLVGTEGIDYHQTNTPGAVQYRYMDSAGVGTEESKDALRQAYIDAGAFDFVTRDHANSEWINYTRTFAPDTYRVYARVAKSNPTRFVLGLSQVTSGSTTMNQITVPLGTFSGEPLGTVTGYDWIPLKDAAGKEMALPLSGIATLRLTMLSGGAGLFHNYFLFAPLDGVQRPFLTAISPAPGAGNEPNNPALSISIRNGDTVVNTGSIQLQIDGTGITPTVTPTSLGADLSYTPSLLSTGWHTVRLVFSDSTAESVTNEWQFHVANRAVRGYWTFDEETAGTPASTDTGSILDLSGNTRNGTVIASGATYVEGSPQYGGTTALRLTGGPDRVVIPDPAGVFNFTDSFTMEAVFRSTSTSTAGSILAKNGTSDGEGEYWWRPVGATSNSGAQRLGVNGAFFTGTKKLNDGEWHHVALVYDKLAGQVRIYAEYSEEGNVILNTDRPIGRPADLHIGGFINTTTSEFDGDIDFIRISEGALAPAEFVQPLPVPVDLINVSRTETSFSFGFATQTGRSYIVESTTSLGGTWNEEGTVPGSGEVETVAYPIEGGRKFFRVRME